MDDPTAAPASRRMLVVVAHPDDETFGMGSLIAHEAARGVQVVVCCATRGEAGEAPDWLADGEDLGAVRAAELRDAAVALGASRVILLDFADSGMTGEAEEKTLAGAPFDAVVSAVRAVVDDVDPDVVATLDPVNGDGHRDHTRIGAATVAACEHRPSTLVYAWTVPRSILSKWFAELEQVRPDSAHLDLDLDREGLGRPLEQITTVLDTSDVLDLRNRASEIHRSQKAPFDAMSDPLRHEFLTRDHLVRLQPPWIGGATERSLG
jgi:LmbE family N-acetylglucosaminyl deacetylase